jgi:hypothetical protein
MLANVYFGKFLRQLLIRFFPNRQDRAAPPAANRHPKIPFRPVLILITQSQYTNNQVLTMRLVKEKEEEAEELYNNR